MIRNRSRGKKTILPFRIRNNFRRLSSRPNYAAISKRQNVTSITDNDGDEIMFGNDNDDDNDDDETLEYIDFANMASESSENDEEEEEETLEYIDFASMASESSENDEYQHEHVTSSDTASSGSEERYDNVSSKELFVDMALDGDKLPSFDGDYAPYFQNFTTAALFCWINKHNISTNAYEDLVDIITKPEFNRDHIVKNVRRFRTWRQHLPLLPISAKSISILSKKTPSTSKDFKMAYQLSINDIIWHVLNNPLLIKNMYFGPGVDSETKSEYWHGTLWAESPLFGQEKLTISGGNYT